MADFAKLFHLEDIGQVLVKRDTDENGDPEVRLYFEPEGFGVCSTAFGFEADETEDESAKAERAFDMVDQERAEKIIRGVMETLPKLGEA